MKRQTIFNTLILTLMVFSSLFVANLSPHIKVSAESIPVIKVSGNTGNKYKDSNGNYYEKAIAGVSANATNTIYTMPSTGTKPTRGDTLFFKYEPIVWQVLEYDSTNNRALVASVKILANMAFQPTFDGNAYSSGGYTSANGGDGTTTTANDYTYSNIRYWLNGYKQKDPTDDDIDQTAANYNVTSRTLNYGTSFYDTAFTSVEQNKIVATSGIGESDSTTYIEGAFNQSNPTGADKLFLLSYADAKTYLSASGSIVANPGTTVNWYGEAEKAVTDFSASQGAQSSYNSEYKEYTETGYNGAYVLRSATNYMTPTANSAIASSGWITSTLGGAHDIRYGIAPAMYIDTADLTFYTDTICETQTTAAAKTYIQFGSYPQTVDNISEFKEKVISVPETGVSINTMGIILSSTILIGLFVWMGFIAKSAIKSRKRK